MRLFATHYRARAIIAGASWTLLVIGLCSLGGDAKADCVQDARHRVTIGADLASLDLAGRFRGDQPEGTNPATPKPCNGPSCSGNPATPTTDAPATPIEVEAWAILALPVPPIAPSSGSRPDDSALILPLHDGSTIFHPPRRPA